ncbi:anti-sigma factor domain-containing protein [Metabacillus sp. Hm71]|uniref:anti-sigma factor domain-containing protein n=1 Tax=Metabacillus sp. Hm71 TaxID=3450743 RepID=UPI003F42D06E
MKRGVVVEYNDDFVTLLTPDGQFLKASNKEGNYEIGEEISFFPLMDKREEAATRVSIMKQRNLLAYFQSRKVRIGTLSVLAIMLFMISFIPFFNQDKVYAYMSIDINPSFEMAIDDNLKVILLEPLNKEAEMLIDQLPEWENKHFQLVVDSIVAESKEKGYVYPGKEIVITTVIKNEDSKSNTKLSENIEEIRTSFEHKAIEVKAIESDIDTREKAQQQGISTGKYLELIEKDKAPIESSGEQIDKQDQDEKKAAAEQTISETNQQATPGNNQLSNSKDATVITNNEKNVNKTLDIKNVKKENPSHKEVNINRNNKNNQNNNEKKDQKQGNDDWEDDNDDQVDDNQDDENERKENPDQNNSDDIKEKNWKNKNNKEENRDKKQKKENKKDRDDDNDDD